MRDDVKSEIIRLDRIAKRARAHQARGAALGDFLLEMRASRLEAEAEARLDATVCDERPTAKDAAEPHRRVADDDLRRSPAASVG